MRLAGKRAIITGGASGIGRATARLFAREGARVMIGDIDALNGEAVASQITAEGGEAQFVPTDVSLPADVERLIGAALDAYGTFDCLFNNAGVDAVGDVTDVSLAAWDRAVAINLRSVFLGCKYALPHLIAAGAGVIINNSSNAGLIGRPDDPVYCATKHGVIGLTKALALRYGPQQVRVNAICPGPVATALLGAGHEATGDAAAAYARSASLTALKRVAAAEEVAELVLFLASDAARNITGAAIPTDGGKTAGVIPGLVSDT